MAPVWHFANVILDCYGESTLKTQQKTDTQFYQYRLPQAEHTVKIRVKGKRRHAGLSDEKCPQESNHLLQYV